MSYAFEMAKVSCATGRVSVELMYKEKKTYWTTEDFKQMLK